MSQTCSQKAHDNREQKGERWKAETMSIHSEDAVHKSISASWLYATAFAAYVYIGPRIISAMSGDVTCSYLFFEGTLIAIGSALNRSNRDWHRQFLSGTTVIKKKAVP
jgi:hypothetical protein